MWSHTRQLFPLYQVQYRAQVDTLFYNVLCWFFLISCYRISLYKLDIKRFYGKLIWTRTIDFTLIGQRRVKDANFLIQDFCGKSCVFSPYFHTVLPLTVDYHV